MPFNVVCENKFSRKFPNLQCMAWPWITNVNENILPPVDCEAAKTYSAILFVNLGDIIVDCMQ